MEISCVACTQTFAITEGQLGGSVKCPACQSNLLLRHGEEVANTAPKPELVRTRKTSRHRSLHYANALRTAAPGAVLLVQALIALFINGLQLLATREITDDVANADALRTSYLTTVIFAAIYQAPILIGSIQMIMRQHMLAGKVACILALVPVTMFTYGVHWRDFALFLYPLAVVGGAWGMIELTRNRPAKRPRGRIGYS